MHKSIKSILVAFIAALAAQSQSFACTIKPTSSGMFYGTGIVGQYCLVNPPTDGTISGQCWGMTSGGGAFSGPSFGWRPFVGTATPTGVPVGGYDLNITSGFGNVHVHCTQG